MKVPRVTPFATRGITKRLRGSKIIYEQRDELAMDLLGLYSAKVTDVVDIVHREDGSTSVDLKDVGDIPENALRAIRKIKVTPTRHGEQVEVEMIDKVRIGQMLAKSAGLLDNEKEIDKPGVVSIEMVMPRRTVMSEPLSNMKLDFSTSPTVALLRARVLSGGLWGLWAAVKVTLAVRRYGVVLLSKSLVRGMGLSIRGL